MRQAEMTRNPCSVCFETDFESKMENIDFKTMPLELFAPLKYGVWSSKAVFKFTRTFAALDGMLFTEHHFR
jgi:hypothetical protein